MHSTDPILVATDLCRRFGEGDAAVDALKNVSVSFPKGQFTAVMGPSGSGKSTLMHNLAGLDRPTSGSVMLDGVELTGLDDGDLTQLRRDKVGFIFQAYNLLPILTAEENIVLPLSIAGRKPDPELRATLIEAVGIGDRLSHRPVRALRRPAAARRDRAGADHAPGRRLRRRADRQPRLQDRRRGARAAAPRGRRLRPDGDHGDPRRRTPPPTRTAWSCSSTAASSTTAPPATSEEILDLMKAVA